MMPKWDCGHCHCHLSGGKAALVLFEENQLHRYPYLSPVKLWVAYSRVHITSSGKGRLVAKDLRDAHAGYDDGDDV